MDSLLKTATCVIPKPKRGADFLFPLGWLSDTKLAAAETLPIKKLNGQYAFRCVALELTTGQRQQLGEQPRRLRGGVLSHDGKWVLENPLNSPFELTTPQATTLDGKQKQSWLRDKDKKLIPCAKPLWLSDSRTWVFLAFDNKQIYAVTGKLASSTQAKIIPLGEPSQATGGWGWGIDGIAASQLIANPKDDLIIGVRESSVYSKIDLWRYEFRLSQGQRSRREFKIPFPSEDEVDTVVDYSSQSQRLALLTTSSKDWRQKSLHTMRLDGSQRVCLGTLKSNDSHLDLEWLPSGKKLSFRYDNALWVVPDTPPKQPQII
jgi:hypothetical protein